MGKLGGLGKLTSDRRGEASCWSEPVLHRRMVIYVFEVYFDH